MTALIELIANFQSSFSTLPASTQPKINARFKKVAEHFKANPVSLETGYLPWNSPNVMGAGVFVKLGSLMDALNKRSFTQNPTNPSNVLNIIDNPETGLLKMGHITETIQIGYDFLDENLNPENKEEISEVLGGTHRINSILLTLFLSGHDLESDVVRDVLVKVEPKLNRVEYVLTSNGSRAVGKVEERTIKDSVNGVDFTPLAYIEAFLRKEKTAAIAIPMAFVANVVNDTETYAKVGLGRDTLKNIGATAWKEISNYKPFKALYPKFIQSDWLQLIDDLSELLPSVLEKVGVNPVYSNVARNYTVYANALKVNYIELFKKRESEKAAKNVVEAAAKRGEPPLTLTKVEVSEVKPAIVPVAERPRPNVVSNTKSKAQV